MEEKTRISTNINTKRHQYLARACFGLVFISVILVFFSVCDSAQAATFYFSPSSGAYKVGQQFSVGVYVSSADQAMNAAEGQIDFSQDKLSVVSLSKSGSVANLWAEEPSFSNSGGTVNFASVVLNPGYTGGAGKILSITFKAKAEGNASVGFDSASILANDGAGTNIFTGAGDANFTISSSAGAAEAPAPPAAVTVPGAPKVSSTTHPIPEKWYANNNPVFEWALAKNITGVNVLADRNPATNPGTRSDGLRNSWTYKDVDEGEWYFHIRLQNSAGWGAITHFKFNIDTKPPDELTAAWKSADDTDPQPVLQLKSHDATSGVDHYEIAYGDINTVCPNVNTNECQLNTLDPGDYAAIIKAVDKAGNSKSIELSRTVEALETPVLTVYPERVAIGQTFTIRGTTKYPDANVFIYIEWTGGNSQQFITKTDSDGAFVYNLNSERLREGTYNLWVQVADARGAKSNPTDKISFEVSANWSQQLWDWTTKNILWIIMVLAALALLILIILLTVQLYKNSFKVIIIRQSKKSKKILSYVNQEKISGLIRELDSHIAAIDKTRGKRRLTWKEKKLRWEYKKIIKWLNSYIEKNKS